MDLEKADVVVFLIKKFKFLWLQTVFLNFLIDFLHWNLDHLLSDFSQKKLSDSFVKYEILNINIQKYSKEEIYELFEKFEQSDVEVINIEIFLPFFSIFNKF